MEVSETEILTLKSIAQTFLTKIEALEKKMQKKPSKRVTDKQERLDRQYIRMRGIIERSRQRKMNQKN